MGIANNQISTVDNLINDLYYRVDVNNSQYKNTTKGVTENMLQSLSDSSKTTAAGRAVHTKVDCSPTYPTVSVTSSTSSGSSSSTVDVATISFTTPVNVGSKTTCRFDKQCTITVELTSGSFSGTSLIANVQYDIIYPDSYSGSTTSGTLSITSNSNASVPLTLPVSFICNDLRPNSSYSIIVRVSDLPVGRVTATASISDRPTSITFQCHNKLMKFKSLLNDCEVQVPVLLYISNAKNVSTKFNTVKVTYNYKTSSTSSVSSKNVLTKEFNNVPANGNRSSVEYLPIYSQDVPDSRYNSYTTIWGGTAGAKQDVRIGFENSTGAVDYGEYTNGTTKSLTVGSTTNNDPNTFAFNFQNRTGIYFNVK